LVAGSVSIHCDFRSLAKLSMVRDHDLDGFIVSVLEEGVGCCAFLCPYSGWLFGSFYQPSGGELRGLLLSQRPIASICACGSSMSRLAVSRKPCILGLSAFAFVFQEFPIKGTLKNRTCRRGCQIGSSPDNRSDFDRDCKKGDF